MPKRVNYKLGGHLGVRVSEADLQLIEWAQAQTALNRSEIMQRLIRSFLPVLTQELMREREERINSLTASLAEEGVSLRIK